ncbi:MAG TPA: lysyl oxidase family protein [Candidatus Limnocylindrales bacterium]|nr:lysyl oxidase family protein [Candidatus Limnocylindrales bacterium]
MSSPRPGGSGPGARPARRRALLPLVAGAALVGSSLSGAVEAAPVDLLPDLRMGRPVEFRVVAHAGGRRLLRLTTAIVNAGRGPFEVRATRPSTGVSTMTVRQRIRRADGTWRTIATGATARYTGDGHDHWHVQRVATYELFAASGALVRASPKVGFCFFDTRREAYLGSAILSPRYAERGCGTRRSGSVTMGISPGWSDLYPYTFAHQWIDVSGLRGTFVVRVAVDPEERYLEASETNNCAWARISLSRTSPTVTVLSRGVGCQPPGLPPLPPPAPTPVATPTPAPSPTATPSDGLPTPSPTATPLPSEAASPSASPTPPPSGG